MLASVIVNNFNYGRFLREAVESAVGQTHPDVEVIVVDDGSTDESRDVIASFGGAVRPVLKENGGQTSALNAGFAASHGEAIVFLDADDVLLPTAVEAAVAVLAPDVAKVHWPLLDVDEGAHQLGTVTPGLELDEGDLRQAIVAGGPESYASVPTSGNLWARWFLDRVLPLPEREQAHGFGSALADSYLADLAPLFGQVRALREPQALYRLHGANDYASLPPLQKFERDRWSYDDRCRALAAFCEQEGMEVDVEAWKRDAWLYRIVEARAELAAVVPEGETVVLVDDDQIGPALLPGRRVTPFVERGGQSWGAPPDDAAALRELKRIESSGARFIAFAWPAFWWLEYYARLRDHLRARFPCVLANDRVVVFSLTPR